MSAVELHPGASGTPSASCACAGTRLLTADELSERWQVPRSHVYRLARAGAIPTVRIGKYQRFRLVSIEQWESAQEATTDG